MKTILYGVCHDKNHLYNIQKIAVFEDRSTAYIAKEKLNDAIKEKEKQYPAAATYYYAITEQWATGGWQKQRAALIDATKNELKVN